MTQMINTNENKVSNIANVYFLDYDKIHHNPLNDEIYGTTEDISQIKQNLLINGLQSPLEVVKEMQLEGKETSYRLLSGHGRYDSLISLYSENQTVMYQGKALGNKIPCLIHTPFESSDAELEYLLGGNVRKFRDKDSIKRAAIKASEIYENKKANGELAQGETKRKYISIRVGISERSVDKYIKLDDADNKQDENIKIKVPSLDSVLKDIDKASSIVDAIMMYEYGRSDRETINNKIDELINKCKLKKREK